MLLDVCMSLGKIESDAQWPALRSGVQVPTLTHSTGALLLSATLMLKSEGSGPNTPFSDHAMPQLAQDFQAAGCTCHRPWLKDYDCLSLVPSLRLAYTLQEEGPAATHG